MRVNPYRTPESVDAFSRLPAKAKNHSRVTPLALWAAILAYLIWVGVLLSSTPVDRKAGQLMMLNVPALVLWGIVAGLGSRFSVALGLTSCGMQCLIAVIMLIRDIGDWQLTILFNGIILAILLLFTIRFWKSAGKRHADHEASGAPCE